MRPGKPQHSTGLLLLKGAATALLFLAPLSLPAQKHFDGAKAYEYARQFVAIGPRWPTSQGHLKAEEFLRAQFKHDRLEEDAFTANTPIGPVAMRNFIVRFPGKKDGVIVLSTHYETNYYLRNINFVGANDGAATTGLLLAIADQLRGKTLDGYSVWLVFFDGEEAIDHWTDSDSTYGSRHLAARWGRDGTLGRIRAFILADMIGDKDLDILRDSRSTDWLVELVRQAAKKFGYERYFFQTESGVQDDHLAFVQRGVPSIDVIDLDYGPNNSYHHTAKDTLDKISVRSLTIDGDVFMETIRLINQRQAKIRAQGSALGLLVPSLRQPGPERFVCSALPPGAGCAQSLCDIRRKSDRDRNLFGSFLWAAFAKLQKHLPLRRRQGGEGLEESNIFG